LQSGVDALIAADDHRHPTPGSIATAEPKLKEGARAERAKAAMVRAQAADCADDTNCLRASASGHAARNRAVESPKARLVRIADDAGESREVFPDARQLWRAITANLPRKSCRD